MIISACCMRIRNRERLFSMAAFQGKTRAILFSLVLVLTGFQGNGGAQANYQASPQFVFVPGIGHGAWCFAPLITILQDAGYSATAVDLTAQGINKAIADDVATVAEYLQPLTDLFQNDSRPKIIVGHSLGGAVISVIAETFPGKVAKAVFLAGVYPTNNETFFSALPASTLARLVGDGNLIIQGNPPTSAALNTGNLTAFFYNKSPEVYVTFARFLLDPTPYRPGTEPITLTSGNFGMTRKFYLKTLADFGITPEEQQEMIDASPWKPERIYKLPGADHAAFFSQTALVANCLMDIAHR